jgi:hypothetical protein
MVWLRSIQTNPRKQIITFDPEGLIVVLKLKSHHTAHSLPFQKNQKRNCEGNYNKRKEQRCFVLSIFRTLPGLNLIYKFTTSVHAWRSSGPSRTDDRARPGKNGRGADWLWRWPAGAGWARESPCRSAEAGRTVEFRPMGRPKVPCFYSF